MWSENDSFGFLAEEESLPESHQGDTFCFNGYWFKGIIIIREGWYGECGLCHSRGDELGGYHF